jgi:hypothetical protein
VNFPLGARHDRDDGDAGFYPGTIEGRPVYTGWPIIECFGVIVSVVSCIYCGATTIRVPAYDILSGGPCALARHPTIRHGSSSRGSRDRLSDAKFYAVAMSRSVMILRIDAEEQLRLQDRDYHA